MCRSPSIFPRPADASHAQVMRSSADGHVGAGQSLADEQIGQRPSADEQSDEKSSYVWVVEDHRDKRVCRPWWNARFQGTLPLALSARIPLEVFRLVVDEMYPPTLTVAALVCAAWHPRAMHNLYHTVEIRSRTSYNLLFKQCYASPRVKQWLASTCKLVADGERDAYSDMHEDDLEAQEKGKGEHGSVESPRRRNKSQSDNHVLPALPFALAGLMPRVRILYICSAGFRFIHTDFFLALSRFESVKSLTLDYCRLNNVTHLRRIVSAFPQLTDFTMNVDFAREGAASYAGTSLFRAPSHMRLRYLDVTVEDKCMAMFLDWMTHSGLCNSLADLSIWSGQRSMALTSLNQLLETVGASLTHFCERFGDFQNYDNALTHGNLFQNTALQSLDIKMHHIDNKAEFQVARAAWTKAADELHDIFSTIRSRQLEHIKVRVQGIHDNTVLEGESAVLEKLDLRDLHEVISQPYFDALKDVEVKMKIWPRIDQAKLDLDSIAQELEVVFCGLLRPWSDRGIVDTCITCWNGSTYLK
ncbi:uncharacterized protein B0H18DRAFT_952636 [Fomitopsis serialis]|uniref:uncharacterized protein n=1 Tax=Fomitopsis serialis TaxID=139415 RepID=UPI002007A091|nr:uncharacterized protein B0H18DRAFT_952636 [Neoantrodia serialis]KAH9931423.1 hypothetical protein B0H18DRAFT_952636 [Neoantrodia serialis]